MTECYKEYKEYKGYSLFNDVENTNLRSWNRAAVMHNMANDGHQGLIQGYISQLDKASTMQCYVVMKLIVDNGLEAAKKDILSNVPTQ